jgi:hypothetical protein
MYRGTGSCSAAACHGAIAPVRGSRVRRDEHTTWVARDKHAQAFQVLFGTRSQTIAKNLGGKVPAHQDTRCLACHATGGSASAPVDLLQDGVGCESCHGASGGWLQAHTTFEWQSLDPHLKKESFGMEPLDDWTARAATCAGCHVGSAGRDVDHDLIAAGHPRLNFEFAAYQDLMPRHWVEKPANARPEAPARAWAIGQLVAAKAALDLLRARAQRAEGDRSRWPEFAEYECFACHHDLRDERWRRERQAGRRPLGSPPWGSWYFPMALILAGEDPGAPRPTFERRIGDLRAAMAQMEPTPSSIAELAKGGSAELGRWLEAMHEERFDRTRIEALFRKVQPGIGSAASSWDLAAQRYLALVPLRQSLAAADPSRAQRDRAETETLFKQLQFPASYDSPRSGKAPKD